MILISSSYIWRTCQMEIFGHHITHVLYSIHSKSCRAATAHAQHGNSHSKSSPAACCTLPAVQGSSQLQCPAASWLHELQGKFPPAAWLRHRYHTCMVVPALLLQEAAALQLFERTCYLSVFSWNLLFLLCVFFEWYVYPQ